MRDFMDVYLQEIDEKKYSKTDFNETALLGAAHLHCLIIERFRIYDISRLFGSFKTSTFLFWDVYELFPSVN